MKCGDEFINGNDGCQYKCIRSINATTFEVQLVSDKHTTFQNLLNTKAENANFHVADMRIKCAAGWIKSLFNTNPLKGKTNEKQS